MRRYIDLELENRGDPSQDDDPTRCPRCGGTSSIFADYCMCDDATEEEAGHADGLEALREQMRLSLEPYRDDRGAKR